MTHLKKEIKDNVRKRFHWQCVKCGRHFHPAEHDQLTVHHVRLPINGEHLIPLCRSCHDEQEKIEKKV